MDARIEGIAIKGISSCVPRNVEDNMDFVPLLGERRVKKQIRLTGIRKRHTSPKYQLPSDLASFAAEKLIQEMGWNKDEIGVLIFVTQGGDYVIPSTAICLQDRLGLPKDCFAFDINLGCSAFNYGVQTVANILKTSSNYKKGLCLIADYIPSLKARRFFNVDSISFAMLSGSAASAVALECEEGNEILFSGCCDGSNYDAIIKTSFLRDTMMKGNVVFDFAINEVSEALVNFKSNYNLSEEDIDYYIFHQAQKLMLESIVNTCDLPSEKVLFSLEEYGNTSGASVPLTLNANSEIIKKKDKVRLLLCGFGVGLSYGVTYLEMETKNILSVEETDSRFHDEQLPKDRLHDTTTLLFDADTCIGQSLAQYLNDCHTDLILCGKDETVLKQLQESLYRDCQILAYNNLQEFIDRIPSDITINGIVNLQDYEIAEWLSDSEQLVEQVSVVVISGDGNQELFQQFMKVFRQNNNNARVNLVEYSDSSMDFYEEENNVSWGEKFMEDNMPSDMIRTNYLKSSICWLLEKKSRFISGSIIRVDDKCEWF